MRSFPIFLLIFILSEAESEYFVIIYFKIKVIINADEYEPLNTFLGSCRPKIVLVVAIYLTIYGILCRM